MFFQPLVEEDLRSLKFHFATPEKAWMNDPDIELNKK